MGKRRSGLYYLVNSPVHEVEDELKQLLSTTFSSCVRKTSIPIDVVKHSYSLWHHRLGHVSDSSIRHIPKVFENILRNGDETCLSCPIDFVFNYVDNILIEVILINKSNLS